MRSRLCSSPCIPTAIAFACGFNDATTFGRAFRAAFGMTPRDYRRAARTAAG